MNPPEYRTRRRALLPRPSRGLSSLVLLAVLFLSVSSRADIVAEWNETLTQLSRAARSNPAVHLEARVYALAHLAMEDAIAAAGRESAVIGDETMATASASTAAAATLAGLFPRRAPEFEACNAARLAPLPEGAAKQRGVELGRAAAAGVLRKRETDQWLDLTLQRDGAPGGAGAAALSAPPANATPGASPWLRATPLLLKRADQFKAEPLFDVLIDGAVVLNARLVRGRIFEPVDRRTPADVLQRFWSERPVADWNRIARELIAGSELDLASRARVFAALNVALADAALAAIHWRHVFALGETRKTSVWVATEDPALLERQASVDEDLATVGVRQAVAHIVSPPARNFPATSAAVAGAAQAVLRSGLRTAAGACALAPPAPGTLETRRYASLADAGAECAFAASLDGAHTREACVSGFLLGADIGAFVAKRTLGRR